ncbi:MAG: hypothetical protein OEM23_06700 [Gemmatimonadota bacterium]|nr:hypothetical protein [Gemmatimonadota bacterium]MDH3428109.1 hypothetical protein [Gemmatimonadota bacterium]
MRHWTILGGLVTLLFLGTAAPLAAQDEPPEAAAEGPHLPADSMELGAKYMDWVLNYEAEELWEALSDGMKEAFGSVGDMLDRMGGLFEQIGEQERVISERYWMRNGKPQFWYTAKFANIDEPIVFRFVIEPDGEISGIGFNPESQTPAVDDPNQHGDVDS